jgi:hypothetical protein
MGEFRAVAGEGRTEVSLRADTLGDNLVILIYNENAHIGAVAVGEWDEKEQRASVSVHTRLGHKDDTIAQKAAYTISKSIKKPVCVIAGVHIENITAEEIKQVLDNAEVVVGEFIKIHRGT